MSDLATTAIAGRQSLRREPFINQLQDLRRRYSPELLTWYAQLGDRLAGRPTNVWWLGDSTSDGAGTTTDYKRAYNIVRDGVQQQYRPGGAGFIPGRRSLNVSLNNPDGKNQWSGTLVDNTDYGFGFGRRTAFLMAANTRSITVDCTSFWLHYTTGGGVITYNIDPGTPFALGPFTINTADATGLGMCGRLRDSFTDAPGLTPGTHTITIVGDATGVFVDGITVFNTDKDLGVHFFEGAQSGYYTGNFAGVGPSETYWSDIGWQGANPVTFTDGVANGTNVFTSATAAFVDNDTARLVNGVYLGGEWVLLGAADVAKVKSGAFRILARSSGTSITVCDRDGVARNITAGTAIKFRLTRSQFTDGAITSGSNLLNSAALAQFTTLDEGCYIVGATGIPDGTRIIKRNSATQAVMSANATATQSSQTIRIQNRRLRSTEPHLLVIQLGLNDNTLGLTPDQTQTYLQGIVDTATDRSALDVVPSVLLVPMWSHSLAINTTIAGTIVSGDPWFTSEQADFDPVNDVGIAFVNASNAGIPNGTTLISDAGNTWRRMRMSANATASNSSGAILTARKTQEKHFKRFRLAMHRLAVERGYAVLDMHSLAGGGWIGRDDKRLTADLIHPNDRGYQFLADEYMRVLTGVQKISAIPNGLADAKGDIPVALAADNFGKLTAGPNGQAPFYASGAPTGLLPMAASSAAAIGLVVPTPGGVTAITTGLPAPTFTVAPTNAADNEAEWLDFATTAVSGNANGTVWAFNLTRIARLPEYSCYFKADGTNTTVQYVLGLISATGDGNPPAASTQGAYFWYNTTSHGTAFWRTCTSGGTITTKTTTWPIAAGGTYRLLIVPRGVRASIVNTIDFYIDDVLVSTHSNNLPSLGTPLAPTLRVVGLGAIRHAKFARLGLSGP